MTGSRAPRALLPVAVALLVAACGVLPGSTSSPGPTLTPGLPSGSSPSPAPGSSAAPSTAPTALDVYAGLLAAGLQITGNNSRAMPAGQEPRRKIAATYAGWPLYIIEYGSAKSLAKKTGFNPKQKPGVGEPPYIFVGRNFWVDFGPRDNRRKPAAPDEAHAAAALALVNALHPLIGPLRQRSIAPVALPTPTPKPTPTPSPTPTPTPTPSPTPTPTPTPTPKPTPTPIHRPYPWLTPQ